MDIEKILSKAYNALKSDPYLALPPVIGWIPLALDGLVFALALKEILAKYSFETVMLRLVSDPLAAFYSALEILAPYALVLLLVWSVSVFLSYYVRAVYPFIAKSVRNSEPASIAEALERAKKRFMHLLWTDFIFGVMVFGFIGMIIIAGILVSALLGSIGVVISIFAAFFLFAEILAYSVPMDIVLDGIVILENKRGIAALKEAYALIRNRKLDSWVFSIAVAIITGVYAFLVSVLQSMLSFSMGDYAAIIAMLLMLFTTPFSYISKTLFYFELSPSPLPPDLQKISKAYSNAGK